MPDIPKLYEHRALIICEGPEDVSFFSALIFNRQIARCHIEHTGLTRNERGGNGKFGSKLRTLKLNRSFQKVVDRILLVTDSDESQDAAVAVVKEQLTAANLPCPDLPFVTVAGPPKVAVATPCRRGSCVMRRCLPPFRKSPHIPQH